MRSALPVQDNFDRPMLLAFSIGAAAALICAAGFFISGPEVFLQAYLYSFMFWLGISLGGLGLLSLHWTSSTTWGMTIRRVLEANSASLWLLAVLFIPIVIGLPILYSWAKPAEAAASSLLQSKAWYLNAPFFVVRAVVYFILWILLGYLLNRRGAALASLPLEQSRGRLQTLGASGMLVYVFTMTFASIDWLMSLEPEWLSTAFGMIVILAQVLSAMSFAILMLNLFPSLTLGRRWSSDATPVSYQELGALLLTMVMSFAYVAFFQYLITWAGNIPREAIWYLDRTQGGWSWVILFVVLFQFAIPFCILISIRVRHNLRLLAWLSALLLVANLVDVFWLVKPVFSPNSLSVSWLDILMPIAFGGIWLGVFFFNLKRCPALTGAEQMTLQLDKELVL